MVTFEELPRTSGIYIFRDNKNKPLYVGKSVDLKNRIQSYFQQELRLPPKTKQLIQKIDTVETIETETEIEALLLEASLIQTLRPAYNTALKDDKRYKYIEVTDSFYHRTKMRENVRNKRKVSHPQNAYPGITTTRHPTHEHSLYFGPFPQGQTVNSVVKTLRKIFGWCAYKSLDQLNKSKRPCFYFQIGLCPGYCAGTISYEAYLAHIDTIIRFLRGEKREIIRQYDQSMTTAAKREDYEEAARYRDLLERLQYVTQQFSAPESYIGDPTLREEQFFFARQQLRETLGALNNSWSKWLRNLERIEAFDISNLQGAQATGSMVVFVEGEPLPHHYRRFKIRRENTPNDVAMMYEVLQRRLRQLTVGSEDSFRQMPQLIVIDGGKTQVAAALRAMSEAKLDIPLIGLAKKEEVLVVPVVDRKPRIYHTVRLSLDSPALLLMKHIRDEAHRFAKKYHVLLRGNESIKRDRK